MAEQAQLHRAFLSLGSNLGDRLNNIERACDQLYEQFGELRLSQLYETAPVGCPDGSPNYLNAAVEIYCELTPHRLLESCLSIEASLGRVRSGIQGEARSCDIDIISYDDVQIEDDRLSLPHPRAAERGFVLRPLCDIDPQLQLPGQQLNVSELLMNLAEQDKFTTQALDL